MIELRPYQEEIIRRAREEVARGRRRVLIVAPTGAGKTHILAHNLASFLERRSSGVALYVVHRRQLVEQTHAVLTKLGVPATIVMAGYDTDWSKRVYVVSRDTWERRKEWINFGSEVGLLIFDEAHIGISAQLRVVKALEPEVVLGYTATPVSLSGPGMGALYEAIVLGPTYAELIGMGYLVPTKWVVAKQIDTSGLRVSKTTGDYVVEDVVRLVRGQVLADVYEAWAEYAGERTVIFAPTVDVAATIAGRFGSMGIRAASIDWSTPPRERRALLSDFREGKLPILVNVDVFSEGWDEPLVDTIILANPTRSLARHLQRIGRGMRPAPGKGYVRIIDLVGAAYEHGAPEDIEGWELEPARRVSSRNGGSESLVKRKGLCPICRREMKGRRCECGYEPVYLPRIADLEVIGGKLEEVGVLDSEAIRQNFYRQLLWYVKFFGKKDGFAAHLYKDKYGEFPPWEWRELEPVEPTPATWNFIRSRLIRWAKRKSKLYRSEVVRRY